MIDPELMPPKPAEPPFKQWRCLKCLQLMTCREDARMHRFINLFGPNKCVDAMGPRKKWGCKTGSRPIVKHPLVKPANREGWREVKGYHEAPQWDPETKDPIEPKVSVLWRVMYAQ